MVAVGGQTRPAGAGPWSVTGLLGTGLLGTGLLGTGFFGTGFFGTGFFGTGSEAEAGAHALRAAARSDAGGAVAGCVGAEV
ncbi:MAG: hypothetical protein WAK82_30360 [Streptosporangiaceae bacterium]